MTTLYISAFILIALNASREREIVDQSLANVGLSAIQVVIYRYRRSPGIPLLLFFRV